MDEYFTASITERQADSMLRADLMKRLMMSKDYGKDALQLVVLFNNVKVGRLLGYGKHPKSRLLRKIESGDWNFYREFISFYRYKGKVYVDLSNAEKWSLRCFIYPDYQILLYSIMGVFISVLFAFFVMNE